MDLNQSRRDILFRNTESMKRKINTIHTARRPFMQPGNQEPNFHYRPWLEKHVGTQGIEWDWDVSSSEYSTLEIYFINSREASLFELTWP